MYIAERFQELSLIDSLHGITIFAVQDVHVFAKEKDSQGKRIYIVATLPQFWYKYTRYALIIVFVFASESDNVTHLHGLEDKSYEKCCFSS